MNNPTLIKRKIYMKRTIFSIMAVAAVLTGCKETNVDSNSEKGFFVLKSVVADGQMNDIDISTAATKATPAELADVNSFVVKIESNLEGGGTQTYSYSDILDKAIELPTGSYQITAGSPEGKTAAWDQPLFEGIQNFSVVAGATSPVNVKCSLKNAMVSVKCTDTFITELSTFNIKVSANDNDFLTWSKNESGNNLDRQGYFTATELYVQIDGERSLDGSTAALTQTIKNVHPKDHIILNLDARVTGEVQQITLTVDGSVNVRNENVTVGGFEEIPIPDPEKPKPENPDPEKPEPDENAPQLVWASNPDFAAQPLAETMDVKVSQGEVFNFLASIAQQYGMDPNAFIQAIIRNGQIGSAVQEVGRSKGLLSGMRAVTFKSEGETLDLSAFLGSAAEDEESESVEAASAAAAVADELASDEK